MAGSGKVAVVTGAGTGIGRAVALALHSDGWNLALAGRRADKLAATKALMTMGEGRGECFYHATDVTDPLEVKALFHEVRQNYGRLDMLFNNAGMGAKPASMEEISIDEWRKVVDVNLMGVVFCCQEAIKLMKQQSPKGGRIINNGSISAHSPRPLTAPYTATKHAIAGLTKSIALDCRQHSIACSQIDIGNAATEMTEPMAKGIMQADGTMKVESRMDVAHVASAVLYMANLPLEANVLFMTLKATDMPFEGRG